MKENWKKMVTLRILKMQNLIQIQAIKILKKIIKIITKGTIKMVMEMEKNFQEIKGFRIKNRRKMEICQEKIIHQKIVLEKVLNIEKRLDKLKEITMFLRARSLLLVLI